MSAILAAGISAVEIYNYMDHPILDNIPGWQYSNIIATPAALTSFSSSAGISKYKSSSSNGLIHNQVEFRQDSGKKVGLITGFIGWL